MTLVESLLTRFFAWSFVRRCMELRCRRPTAFVIHLPCRRTMTDEVTTHDLYLCTVHAMKYERAERRDADERRHREAMGALKDARRGVRS